MRVLRLGWIQARLMLAFFGWCVGLVLGLRLSNEKTPAGWLGFLSFGAWRCPTLTWGSPTLPSALTCFTSEFEKDSGGSTSLWPPDKFGSTLTSCCHGMKHALHTKISVTLTHLCNAYLVPSNTILLWCCMVKPHGQLVRVSSTHYCASTPRLSTS